MGSIDWDDFRETYNRMHNTKHETAVEWITALYQQHNKFVSPVAKELGVGFGTVSRYLEGLGILERKPKGGSRVFDRTGPKEKLFLSISETTMKELTRKQICERCSISSRSLARLVKKYGRKFKRV